MKIKNKQLLAVDKNVRTTDVAIINELEDIGAKIDSIKIPIPEKVIIPDHSEALKEILLEVKKKEEITDLQISPELKKELKGDPGDPGKDGKDYVLTDDDKNTIAKAIKIPVVKEKTIVEKTEVVHEVPIVKEVAVTDSPEQIADKINTLEKKIDFKVLKNVPNFGNGKGGTKLISSKGGGMTRDEIQKMIDDNDLTHDTLQGVTDRGATTTNIITVPGVKINTASTPSASSPGLIQWNSVDGTYDMGLLNSSVLQVGQETMFYGKASGAIANGDLCQFAGVQGDHILVKKAVGSEIEANPHFLVGVATENISNGTFGYVTWFGKINGVYTKTPANQDSADWTAGDILYFNVTTGQMTKTMPSVPNRIITVAAVIKEQTGASENGIIIVRPTFGIKLQDLDDVNGTPLSTTTPGQIPTWHTEGYFDFDKNISDYVPYTGATGDVDLGAYDLSATDVNALGVFTLGDSIKSVFTSEYNLETEGVGLFLSVDNSDPVGFYSFNDGIWIDMPVGNGYASGIGSGGAGNNAWIAYAGAAGFYFGDAIEGDTCYRNIYPNRLLFGTDTVSSTLILSGIEDEDNKKATVNGYLEVSKNIILTSTTGIVQGTFSTGDPTDLLTVYNNEVYIGSYLSDPSTGEGILHLRYGNDDQGMTIDALVNSFDFNGLDISNINTAVVTNGITYGSYLNDGLSQRVGGVKTLTDATATGFVDIAIPSGQRVGGTIEYTIDVTDGTDFQSHSGFVAFNAVNKGGTITTSIAESYIPASESEAVSAGTLTDDWTNVAGTNKITLKCNANSSLTTPTIKLYYTVKVHSQNAVTKL